MILNNFRLFGFEGFYESKWYSPDKGELDENTPSIVKSYAKCSTIIASNIAEKMQRHQFEHSDRYIDDVVNMYVKGWSEIFMDVFQENITITNPNVASPRSYNYTNDQILCDVEFDDTLPDILVSHAKERIIWLRKHIANDWKSRCGFLSLISDNVDEWIDIVLSGPSNEEFSQYVSLMCFYIITHDRKYSDIDDTSLDWELYEYVGYNNIDYDSYWELNEDGKQFVDSQLQLGFTAIKMDDSGSVQVQDNISGKSFWIDVHIGHKHKDVIADWNQYIFSTDSNDQWRKEMQGDADLLIDMSSAAIHFLVDHEFIAQDSKGEWYGVKYLFSEQANSYGSELMSHANDWFDSIPYCLMEEITGLDVSGFEPDELERKFLDACKDVWNRKSAEERISIWKHTKMPFQLTTSNSLKC